jgi:hypothetical protein
MLKYHLRGPGEAVRWLSLYPDPSVAGGWDDFLCCRHIDLLSLVSTLPLVRVMWRVYAVLCTGLWTIADRRGCMAFWQVLSYPVLWHYIGQRGLGPLFCRGEAPGKGDLFWCWPSGSLVNQIFCGEPHFYRASLSDVRVIMTFMCVLMVELLCQAGMGWISALECMLSGARGSQWLCLILSGIKWLRHPRIPALWSLARYQRPQVWLLGARTHAESGHKEELDRADRWQDPTHPRPLRWDKRTGIGHARV